MANRGKSRHMASLAAPKYFAIERKTHKYIKKPNPGRHTLDRCISLLLALKKLGVASTTIEASRVLRSGIVRVNGRVVREAKFPIGLNDIVAVDGASAYKTGIDRLAKVSFEEVKNPDYNSMLYRVVGKYKAKKGQIMLRLHDGSAVKSGNDAKVNDSVIVDSKKGVKEVLRMDVGAECVVISGVHVGAVGRIKSIKLGTVKTDASAMIIPKKGEEEEFETVIRNIMIVG
jgi:small subunit ribosomal protein S4e